MERDFLPFVRTTKASKPNTVRFYENSVANLKAYSKLASLHLDEITAEQITGFVAHRQTAKVQVSTLNADLATLRRIFHLALEWGRVSTALPRVRLLPGANHRERVLTAAEEKKYLDAATAVGHELQGSYLRALEGIRAVNRGQLPLKPDAYRLRDVATILIDCGMRPEECFRLKWLDNIRDGAIEIHTGKGRGSRRRIPCSQRVLSSPGDDDASARPRNGSSRLRLRAATSRPPRSRSSTRPPNGHRACPVCPVYVPAHVHHALGEVYGPFHAPRSCGPC